MNLMNSRILYPLSKHDVLQVESYLFCNSPHMYLNKKAKGPINSELKIYTLYYYNKGVRIYYRAVCIKLVQSNLFESRYIYSLVQSIEAAKQNLKQIKLVPTVYTLTLRLRRTHTSNYSSINNRCVWKPVFRIRLLWPCRIRIRANNRIQV